MSSNIDMVNMPPPLGSGMAEAKAQGAEIAAPAAAHTPGPWTVNTSTPQHTEVFAGGWLICEAIGGQGHLGQLRNFSQDEANARLIAAAPDGLALAYEVAAHFEGTNAPLERMAHDLIARATGAAS